MNSEAFSGPKVSIITIFFNREKTLLKSVESLIDQTYKNIEIVFVDDNSTDNTLNLIKGLQERDPRITIVANKINKGFTQSLIDTIAIINSTYIAIHGSGDISLPLRVETQVAFLEGNEDCGLVGTGVSNRPVNNISNTIKEIKVEDLLKRNCFNHGTVMFKVAAYKKAGGYRSYFTSRQDKDLWFRMVLTCKLYFLPDRLYEWVKQETSVSMSVEKNYTPTFLSEFAHFLFNERRIDGVDSLELHGDKAALLFNPVSSSHIFYKDLFRFLAKRNWLAAINILDTLIKINSSIFKKGFFYVVRAVVNLFERV